MLEAPAGWSVLPRVCIGWQITHTHGWGLHGWHLAKRFLERRIAVPSTKYSRPDPATLPHPVEAYVPGQPMLRGGHNQPYEPGVIGERDALFQVYEDMNLRTRDVQYLRSFGQRVITVSQWNADHLNSVGIPAKCLHLGVDPEMFKPRPKAHSFGKDRFVIFSGGKAELRKGHDIVLAAFRAFHQRHCDALLVTLWHNFWPGTAHGLAHSPYGCGVPESEVDVKRQKPTVTRHAITKWVRAFGIPAEAHQELGIIDREPLAELFASVDVGLFPNRCEAGTNMVAMEALSSGVPCILSNNSGHRDLIEYPIPCFALERSTPCDFPDANIMCGESDIEEIVEQLESIYQNREQARTTGLLAHEAMKDRWSWAARMDEQIDTLRLGTLDTAGL